MIGLCKGDFHVNWHKTTCVIDGCYNRRRVLELCVTKNTNNALDGDEYRMWPRSLFDGWEYRRTP